jgi:hypothetical protein
MKTSEKQLRRIEVKGGIPNCKCKPVGHFHKWCIEPVYDNYDKVYSRTFAIVELEDGSIFLVEPDAIKFVNPLKGDAN